MMSKWTKCLLVTGLIILLATTLVGCGTTAPAVKSPSVSTEPTATLTTGEGKSVHQKVQLTGKQADGYIIPAGKVNIVCVITDVGMVGCGAFNGMVFDSYGYPAVRVKSSNGSPIATIDDLLGGVVSEVNNEAAKLGIKTGMTGKEALGLL